MGSGRQAGAEAHASRGPTLDKLWVYPDFDPVYYGFYLDGLRQLLGRSRVKLAVRPFTGAARSPNTDRMSVRLLAEGGGQSRRITIESNDMLSFDAASLEWADVVAKVNYERDASPESIRERVISIGPGFGLRAWRGVDLALWSAGVLFSTVPDLALQRRKALLSLYAHQATKRLPHRAYVRWASDPDYLFFVAKGWVRYGYVNEPRTRFYFAAKAQAALNVEGGFVPESGGHPEDLEHLLARRYSLREYLEKTARSVAVFNCPAVHGCLGWKLGEFLAQGKAIISLPIQRELPAPLVHGEHIHYVEDDQQAMADAIACVRRDEAYRLKLERNARDYYDRWVSPLAAARRIVERAGFVA